ncbi:ABC transporter substrate-binding protein [Streptosporangium roseum]|uniref:ABC transporter substrate-binding protein n=1 Tax=Streptosporangium roseum TaxID=2001 RepID=UPI003323B016
MTHLSAAPMNRRGFLQFVGAVSAATAFTGSLAACSGPASTTGPAPAAGADTIEAGISYALSTGFDPMTSSGATPVAANMHVFEALFDLDPATRESYAALAARDLEKVDDTTYKVALRDGATFHDGSAVTAGDVAFSFQRVMDPANASLMVQFIPFVESVTAADAKTVEIKLKYAFPLLKERLAVVKIVPKALVEKDKTAFDAKPVGSGPYRLVEATKEDKIVFERWDKYNGTRPAKVKNMIWRLLSDSSARVTALESGRVAAIEDVPYIDVQKVGQKHKLEAAQSFGLLFLMFNCAEKPFDDKRVRQALHYAIDTDKVIQTAMLGNAAAATGYVQETHPAYAKASTVYGYDPDKAKALLKEAGVSGLNVTMVTTDTGWVKDAVPVIKEGWDAVGVTTTLDIGQSGGQYTNKVDPGKFQILVAPGDPSVFGNDMDLLLRWFFDGLWPQKRFRWDGTKEAGKVLGLLDRAAKAGDAAEQKKLWAEAVDVIAEEAPLYPILHRKLPTAWNDKKLTGFRPIPTTGLSFLDVGLA